VAVVVVGEAVVVVAVVVAVVAVVAVVVGAVAVVVGVVASVARQLVWLVSVTRLATKRMPSRLSNDVVSWVVAVVAVAAVAVAVVVGKLPSGRLDR
jgi:hypothetical protein